MVCMASHDSYCSLLCLYAMSFLRGGVSSLVYCLSLMTMYLFLPTSSLKAGPPWVEWPTCPSYQSRPQSHFSPTAHSHP